MSTRVEMEINMDLSAKRFPVWMALSVFSAVCLASVTTTVTKSNRDAGDKWVLSVCCISMALSFIATVMYLISRGLFVGQVPEMGMIGLLLAFWGAGLPVIMNPGNAIAVAGETVIDANLYFFSWLSFASVLYLSGSLAQDNVGIDVTKTPPKAARWYGLCASSLVVMGASIRLFKQEDCNNGSQELCKRTKFAISAGTIGFFAAVVMTYLTSQGGLAIIIETAATMILLALWCFGVGYITFGSAPGSQIGNLYFATWISFIICVFLFGQCFREVVGARQTNSAAQKNGDHDEGESMNEPQAYPEVPDDEDNI